MNVNYSLFQHLECWPERHSHHHPPPPLHRSWLQLSATKSNICFLDQWIKRKRSHPSSFYFYLGHISDLTSWHGVSSKRYVQSFLSILRFVCFFIKELIRRALFSSVNIKILQPKYNLLRRSFSSGPNSRSERMLNVSKSMIHVPIQVHQPFPNAFSSCITLMISRCMEVPLLVVCIIP